MRTAVSSWAVKFAGGSVPAKPELQAAQPITAISILNRMRFLTSLLVEDGCGFATRRETGRVLLT